MYTVYMIQYSLVLLVCLQMGEPPPGGELDRNNDHVYMATTNVVRAVMDMTRGVQQAKADQYIKLVKVGWTFTAHTLTNMNMGVVNNYHGGRLK